MKIATKLTWINYKQILPFSMWAKFQELAINLDENHDPRAIYYEDGLLIAKEEKVKEAKVA